MPLVAFTTLFDWVTAVSMFDAILQNPLTRELGLAFSEHPTFRLLAPHELLSHKGDRRDAAPEVEFSRSVYSFHGFIESLGTKRTLYRQGPLFQYLGLQLGSDNFRTWYTKPDLSTVVLGLTRIESKESCNQFLDPSSIINWKNQMAPAFRQSPLFEFDEVWRVLCYELAVNVWEHAHSTGFMAARVVTPLAANGEIVPWCGVTYGEPLHALLRMANKGFLELCIADYGQGFGKTLQKAYSERTQTSLDIDSVDLLAFAFDELGTCKSKDQSWVTERHALGRILQIVGKYGGALTLRSAGAEVQYIAGNTPFKRRNNHLGYEPTRTVPAAAAMRGAQLQILLPLVPPVEHLRPKKRGTPLGIISSSSFRPDPSYPRGHLVSLALELSPNPGEAFDFRRACTDLCVRLVEGRPPSEPLILDFAGLDWTLPQFETLLYLLQNLLQQRPVLLIGLTRSMAKGIADNELRPAKPSLLPSEVTPSAKSVTGRSFSEHSEDSFLSAYRGVHCPLLALDNDEQVYMFALPDSSFEKAFLTLIDEPAMPPRTIDAFCSEFGVPLSQARAVLNATSSLFHNSADGWSCVWSWTELAREANRSLLKNFDRVARDSLAWRGVPSPPDPQSEPSNHDHAKPSSGTPPNIAPREIFHLPWQEKDRWVASFLDCSRILSRGRYADEAAQALIQRLNRFLTAIGLSLSEVGTLACLTAPAVLLATAILRWWPVERGLARPAIIDLGEYLLLHPDTALPFSSVKHGVVVVQDLVNRGTMTSELIKRLRGTNNQVLAVIALVRLIESGSAGGETLSSDWGAELEGVPAHSLVRAPRPAAFDDPSELTPVHSASWVEPRTLRSFGYSELRRSQPRLPYTEGRALISSIISPDGSTCLLNRGHYVYGTRHYSLAIDIRSFLEGELGGRLVEWIADLCLGESDGCNVWESTRKSEFVGDVTAVLMPLHSQIHYLWPRIERLLAQRNRRQHVFLLDATLFLGGGPAYRLPEQLSSQIRKVISEHSGKSESDQVERPLRLLVLDDAIVSSRTIVTIIDALNREVNRHNHSAGRPCQPIEWIRYFAIFNHLGYAQHRHWHALTAVGEPLPIKFSFENYVHCMGLPIYEEASCPDCGDRGRLTQLAAQAEHLRLDEVKEWLDTEIMRLEPVAVEHPSFFLQRAPRMDLPIHLFPADRRGPSKEEPPIYFADAAIARFCELMYRAYPPGDILREIKASLLTSHSDQDEVEHAHYRWAVYEWAIREWPRLRAVGDRQAFLDCVIEELNRDTRLVIRLCESLSRVHDDEYTIKSILYALDRLELSDNVRKKEEGASKPGVPNASTSLYIALQLFFLNLGPDAKAKPRTVLDPLTPRSWLKELERRADAVGEFSLGFIRLLFLRHSQQKRTMEASSALFAIAGTLFRGQDPREGLAGDHRLLVQLAAMVRRTNGENAEYRLLLRGSLGLFIAALNALEPYASDALLGPQDEILRYCATILDWLRSSLAQLSEDASDALRFLEQKLVQKSPFHDAFSSLFHEDVDNLNTYLSDKVKEERDRANNTGRSEQSVLDFHFDTSAVKGCRVLTHKERLCFALSNWTIEPLRDYPGKHKSSIVLSYCTGEEGFSVVRFRMRTSFADPITTENAINSGHDWGTARIIRTFGVRVGRWEEPSVEETAMGFRAACNVDVPKG